MFIVKKKKKLEAQINYSDMETEKRNFLKIDVKI